MTECYFPEWLVDKVRTLEEETKSLKRRQAIFDVVISGMLFQQFLQEWTVIDGIRQHPEGRSFAEWLTMRYPIYAQLREGDDREQRAKIL